MTPHVLIPGKPRRDHYMPKGLYAPNKCYVYKLTYTFEILRFYFQYYLYYYYYILYFIFNIQFFHLRYWMYFFTNSSDPPKLSPAGPTVASLKSECGTKSGMAYKKGWMKWSSCYLVLEQGGETLYKFRTELV
jgi:hypothetical protein